MKKTIEELLKNGIFKKVAMGIVFILACSLACFVNWNATFRAEGDGEGGGGTETPTSTCTVSWGNDISISNVQYRNAADGGYTQLSSNGSAISSFDRSKDLYVRVTFSDINNIDKDKVCLFYNDGSTQATNCKAMATETGTSGELEFHFGGGVLPAGKESYALRILPKGYNFSAKYFSPLFNDGVYHSVFEQLDIKYSTDGGRNFYDIPNYNISNLNASGYPNGRYYNTLYFDDSRTKIKLKISGKSNFDIANLKYTTDGGINWPGLTVDSSGAYVTGNISVSGEETNVNFKSPVSLTLSSGDSLPLKGRVEVNYKMDGDTGNFKTFPLNADESDYGSLSGIILNQKVVVQVNANTDSGYYTDAMEYKFDGAESPTPWGTDPTKTFEITNQNSTLELSGIVGSTALTPKYHNGTNVEDNTESLFNAATLTYKVEGDDNEYPWKTNATGDDQSTATDYNALPRLKVGKKITIFAEKKTGWDISGMKYTYPATGSPTGLTAVTGSDTKFTTGEIQIGEESNITFSGIAMQTVKLTPKYKDGDSAVSHDTSKLFSAANLTYKIEGNDNEYIWKEEDDNSADDGKYGAISVQEGKKVTIFAEKKTGWNISGMKYKFYKTGITYPATGDPTGLTAVQGSTTKFNTAEIQISEASDITFSGIDTQMVKLTPKYYNGTSVETDTKNLFKAATLTYKIEGDNSEYVWQDKDDSNANDAYGTISVQEGKKVTIFAEKKTGWNISGMKYKFYTGDNYPATGNPTGLNAVTGSTTKFATREIQISENSNITFSGIEKKMVTLSPYYRESSGNMQNWAPMHFYNGVTLKYKTDTDASETTWDTVSANGPYKPMKFQEGTNVTISVESKIGWSVEDLKCKVYTGDPYSNYPSESVDPSSLPLTIENLDEDENITFTGLSEKKLSVTPNYYDGSNFDPTVLYGIAKLSYYIGDNIPADARFTEWLTDDKNNPTKYVTMGDIPEGSTIAIQVEPRNSNLTNLKYKFYTGEYSSDGLQNVTNNVIYQRIVGDNYNVTFSGIECILNPTYYTGNDNDMNPEYLYKAIELKYRIGTGEIKSWPPDQSNKKYASISNIGANAHISVYVNPREGYEIDAREGYEGLKYKIYDSDKTYSDGGNVRNYSSPKIEFALKRNSTFAFSNIGVKKVKLHFVDESGNALDNDVVKVYSPAASGTPVSEKTVDNHQKNTFKFTFDHCNMSSYSINNISVVDGDGNDIKNKFAFSDSEEGLGWVDGSESTPSSYLFSVTAATDLSDVYFKLSGITLEDKNIKFVRDGGKLLSVGVGAGNAYSVHEWGANETQYSVDDDKLPKYKSGFEFYLIKPVSCGWAKEQSQLSDLVELSDEDIGDSTCVLTEDGRYRVTINSVKSDLTITLKSDAVNAHTIDIVFGKVNLPKGNNGIVVSQGNEAVDYPDRGAEQDTLKASIFSKEPNKEITIKIPKDQDKFKLVPQEDNKDFVFINVNDEISFQGTFEEEENYKVVKFTLNNDAINALSGGNIIINCYCLRPCDRTISFALNRGATLNVRNTIGDQLDVSTVDEQGNITAKAQNVVSEDNDIVQTLYGERISMTYTLNEGNFLDNPEDQIIVYKVSKNSSGEDELTEVDSEFWTVDADNRKVSFENLLEWNVKVVFNCDRDNIPISFTGSEGLAYYALNLNKDSEGNIEGFNESQPFKLKEGTDEKETIRGIVTVPMGNDYYFAVGVDAGYDVGSLKITQNGHGVETPSESQEQGVTYSFIEYQFANGSVPEGYKFYKLVKVSSNITVSGSVNKREFSVQFEGTASVENGKSNESAVIDYKRDNVSIKSLKVVYGNSAAFTVSLPEKYNQSDFKVWVRSASDTNEQAKEVTKYQNEYRILDVTEDKVVYVTNVAVNQYVVNFAGSDKAEYLLGNNVVTKPESVEYGAALEFRIRAKAGYKLDDSIVVNCQKANGDIKVDKVKDSGSGENVIYRCKITDIKENRTIVVDHISNINYKISFQDVQGATYLNEKNSVITGAITVGYGKNFEFGISVDDAYDDSAAGMFIVLNDGKTKLSAQKLASGRYMIPNITEDVKIKVGNIRKNTYTVTLRNEEGIDYYNSNNKVITGDNTVEHGGTLAFRVSLYPAYSDSSITVMLGKDPMTPDSSGYYKISGIVENKVVTVTGIHANSEVDLVNTINNLPSSINDLNDVNSVIEASKWYESLTDEQKANVSNADLLKSLQQQAGDVLHKSNDVTIDGADWYVKLVVVPISSDMDACARIYKKLSSEYILSLYDIYLWDTLNDVRYIPNGDQMYTVTIPAPKLTNFRDPTGVHENSDSGKVSFMDLTFNGDTVSFQTNSFCPMGVVASHDATGASSLFDAAGVNLDWINDYVLGSANKGSSDKDSSGGTLVNDGGDDVDDYGDEDIGNINDKFRSTNNRVTPQGSALRLILVLLILILLALALWIIYKKRKQNKDDK